jgi:hypothetical protein
LSDYAKPLAEKGVNISLDTTKFNISPDILYHLTKLFKGQLLDLEQFVHLFRLLKKPNKTLESSFNLLNEKMTNSQMALTRSQSIHHSLLEIYDDLFQELEEKSLGIQQAIEDKMKFVEMMSTMEMKPSSSNNNSNSNTKNSNVLDQEQILIEGNAKILVGVQGEWKNCYLFLFKSKLICLNQEMEPVRK